MPDNINHRRRHKFGKAWVDFDHRANVRRTYLVGVEVEFPPTDDNFLLHIPYKGKDAGRALAVAEYLVELLNANRGRRR